MKTQVEIAQRAKVAQPTLANIVACRRRPLWPVVKDLHAIFGKSTRFMQVWADDPRNILDQVQAFLSTLDDHGRAAAQAAEVPGRANQLRIA